LDYSARWRSLPRRQDPLADPLLLELAEEICSLGVPGATVAICGDRLRTRSGQRFLGAVRALGAKVLPAPDSRALAAWAEAPRMPDVVEGLVLVADWRALPSCLSVLRRSEEERGLLLELLGVGILCDRREEQEATSAGSSAELHCRWRVLPSLAF